ncbi:MAG: FG-GAP-like repeat-containing protein, partial [Planctomycetota bacterium]
MVRRSNRRKFSKSSVWVRSGRIHPLAILGVLAAVLIVVGVLVGAGMFGPLANRPNADQDAADSNNLGDNGPNDLAAARDILRQTQTAMVQTESLETEAAIDAWQALIQAHGGDVSRRRNLAIARLLDLDKKASVVSNPASKPEEIASARASIASQLANTGQAIDAFAKDSGDDVLTTWMRDRIARLEAELVPAMSRTRSKERVGRLSAAITNAAATPNAADTANAADTGDIAPTSRSQALILVGPLLDAAEKSSDAIDGLPDSLRGPVTAALKQASRVAPENLSLALQLAKFLAEERSPQAAGALRRSFDLSKAIHPTLQRDLRAIGKTPQSLIDQAIEDIQAQRWEDAEFALISWNNVLRGSELVKTDLKRLSPHPLDLVSLSGLRAAAARVAAAQPIAASKQPAAYQTRAIEAQHSLVDLACLDLNLDQTPEWITLSVNGRVSVGRVSEGGWEAITEVTLEGFERGIRLADLYVVDGGKRGRGAATGGSSHDTLMQLLVFGSAGIRLLEIDDSDASTVGLVPVTSTTGLEELRNVRVVTLGDFEADGDLDLLVVTDQSMHLMVNRGNRTFFEAPLDGSAFEGDLPEQFRIVDLDRDLDLDVITVHPQSGRIGLLENLLHLQLRPRYLDGVEKLERLQNAWVAELDGDVAWDLVLSSADKLRAVTGITESAGTWRAGETFQTNIVSPVRWLDDLDADSYHEALLQAGSMVRFGPQPNGTWGIQKVAEDVLPPTDAADARDAFTSRDTNGDGWPDLGWLENQVLHVGISVPREDAKSVAIRFKGIDDNASGRVNHYAIGSVIEARFGPHYRAQVVTSPVTRFGMDGFETADLRAILPNGLT